MRQGDGSDLLGAGNPHSAEIGIIYVEAADSRPDILKAISTQEMTGRKQIAIVLETNHRAFRQPVDFDGLKNVRRGLKAQLVLVVPSGPGPANFARQRNFQVFSDLDSLRQALLTDGIQQSGSGRMKSKPGGLFSGRKPKSSSPQKQGQGLSAATAPGKPGQPGRSRPPSPFTDVPTAKLDTPGPKDVDEEASGLAGDMPFSDLESDDDALAPLSPAPANPNLPTPIAQGSSTSGSPAGPARPGDSKGLPPRKVIVFPNVPGTPTTTGEIGALQNTQRNKTQTSSKPLVVPGPQNKQSAPGTNNPAVPQDQPGAPPVPTLSGQSPSASLTGRGPAPTGNGQNPPTSSTGRNNPSKAMPAVIAGAGLNVSTGVPTLSASAPTGVSAAGAPSSTGGTGLSSRTPLPPGPPRSSGRRRWRRSLLIWVLVGLLVLLGVAVVFARGGSLGSIISPTPTAQVSITPASQLVQDQYLVVGQTSASGQPDPAKNEVLARVITQISPSKQATGTATGSIAATQASGQLTFTNANSGSITIDPTPIRGISGVPVTFNGQITLPSGNSTITGFAVNAGAGGNIGFHDINSVQLGCCNGRVFVTNSTAFSGGRDPVPNSIITPNDINNAVGQVTPELTNDALNSIKTQIKSTERTTGDQPSCPPNFTADHKAGDQAKTFTVTVTVTCSQIVYDYQGAQQIALNNLRKKAADDTGLTQYLLDGQIITDLVSATITQGNPQQVSIYMHAEGLWVYHFTDQMQQNLKHALLNKSEKDAQTFLQHYPGVALAHIMLSTGNKMPSDVNNIQLTIQTLPGAQATVTPTGTSTGIPPGGTPTSTTSNTPAPTPTFGQTGS